MAKPDAQQLTDKDSAAGPQRRSWKILVAADIAIIVLALWIGTWVGRRQQCTGITPEFPGDSNPFCAFTYVPAASLLAVGVIFLLVPAVAWFWRGKRGAMDAWIAAGLCLVPVGLLLILRLVVTR
jgi:hypothetical protein